MKFVFESAKLMSDLKRFILGLGTLNPYGISESLVFLRIISLKVVN